MPITDIVDEASELASLGPSIDVDTTSVPLFTDVALGAEVDPTMLVPGTIVDSMFADDIYMDLSVSNL